MTELEQEQALEAAKECVRTSMPNVHVEEARLYHYHADTKRWYVEVDVTHADPEQGAAMVLCRVSYNRAGQPEALRVTIVERQANESEHKKRTSHEQERETPGPHSPESPNNGAFDDD